MSKWVQPIRLLVTALRRDTTFSRDGKGDSAASCDIAASEFQRFELIFSDGFKKKIVTGG